MTIDYYFGGSEYTDEELFEFEVEYDDVYKALAKIIREDYGFTKDNEQAILRFLNDYDMLRVEDFRDELKNYFYDDAKLEYNKMKEEKENER